MMERFLFILSPNSILIVWSEVNNGFFQIANRMLLFLLPRSASYPISIPLYYLQTVMWRSHLHLAYDKVTFCIKVQADMRFFKGNPQTIRKRLWIPPAQIFIVIWPLDINSLSDLIDLVYQPSFLQHNHSIAPTRTSSLLSMSTYYLTALTDHNNVHNYYLHY